jgi:rare lipoprotein A
MNRNIAGTLRSQMLSLILVFLSFQFLPAQYKATGNASFYHNKFHNLRTSSGEKYNKNLYSAAHLTLPFGTILKVTSLANDKYIYVKVNDRGPHTRARIIDLSRAAAEAIDMIAAGVTKVKVEEVDEQQAKSFDINKGTISGEFASVLPEDSEKPKNNPDSEKPEKGQESNQSKQEIKPTESVGFYTLKWEQAQPKGFGLQLSSFSTRESTERFITMLDSDNISPAYVQIIDLKEGRRYRIIYGNYDSRDAAVDHAPKLEKKGYESIVFVFPE